MKRKKQLNNKLRTLWMILLPVYEQSYSKPLNQLWETLPNPIASQTLPLKRVLDRV